MKKRTILTVFIAFLTTAVFAQGEVYQVVVENLNTSPGRYLNNEVIIEGVVDRHLDDRTSAGFFYLRDDFGEFVRVRVLENKPEVNKRIRLRGVFTREIPPGVSAPFLGRYYIDSRRIELLDMSSEEEAEPLPSLVMIDSEPSGAEVSINGRQVGTTPIQDRLEDGTYSVSIEKPMYATHTMNLRVQGSNMSRTVELERSTMFYALIGGGGLILLIILGAAFIKMSNGRKKQEPLYTGREAGSGSQPSFESPTQRTGASKTTTAQAGSPNTTGTETTVDNKTVKINVPKDHTIKVLDEYFEVIEGLSEISKLHLYQQPNKMKSEYTFGRNPGTEYYHIQLKSPAVSRQQAKMIVMKDKYVLINYAKQTSNPTRVNDAEMDVNESTDLNIGDVITMGDVKLRFSSKRA